MNCFLGLNTYNAKTLSDRMSGRFLAFGILFDLTS